MDAHKLSVYLFFGVLVAMLRLVLCGTCPQDLRSVAVNCTSPVEHLYGIVVKRVIAGNDSGIDELCRLYNTMLHCLEGTLRDCGVEGQRVQKEATQPLTDTVGAYCSYYREEQLDDTYSHYIGSTTSMTSSVTRLIHSKWIYLFSASNLQGYKGLITWICIAALFNYPLIYALLY